VIEELKEKHGISNRYFIANRFTNGYPQRPGTKAFNENLRCTTSSTDCAAFGRPPYVYKHDKYCDGYLWFGTFGDHQASEEVMTEQLAGMAKYSPYSEWLLPSGLAEHADPILAKIIKNNGSTTNITFASKLLDPHGIPDRKGKYKKGDPPHSNPCQRSLWHSPQLNPCGRTDFGVNNSLKGPFQYGKCRTHDPKGFRDYHGPPGGDADVDAALAYVAKREAGRVNPCCAKNSDGKYRYEKGVWCFEAKLKKLGLFHGTQKTHHGSGKSNKKGGKKHCKKGEKGCKKAKN